MRVFKLEKKNFHIIKKIKRWFKIGEELFNKFDFSNLLSFSDHKFVLKDIRLVKKYKYSFIALAMLVLITITSAIIINKYSNKYNFNNANVNQMNAKMVISQDDFCYKWKAGQKNVNFKIESPKTYCDTSSGIAVEEDNPYSVSVHIFADLNSDGELTDDECIYNDISLDDSNSTKAYKSKRFDAGESTDKISLTKSLKAGTYNMYTYYYVTDTQNHIYIKPYVYDNLLIVKNK